jgi:hypothetical protein
MSRARNLFTRFAGFSIEPVFGLFMFGYAVKTGSGIIEQLLLDKACLVTLGLDPVVCANLSDPINEVVEREVQTVVNDFNLYATMLMERAQFTKPFNLLALRCPEGSFVAEVLTKNCDW